MSSAAAAGTAGVGEHTAEAAAAAVGAAEGSGGNTDQQGLGSQGRKVSTQDIQLVQNLIERCLQMYMSRREVSLHPASASPSLPAPVHPELGPAVSAQCQSMFGPPAH